MNNLLYYISKNKISIFLVIAGVLFLVAPMSTKEEKPLYVYIVGLILVIIGGSYLFKSAKKK